MTYSETVQYLYNSAPLFQQTGAAAYKPGLQVTETLDAHFGHPHRRFATIHVAGTNGKGSCAHTLAAWLMLAGYKVGLYTSPHLTDFRERIRVNGEMMPKEFVVDFVEQERAFFEPLHPSFFELTTALAFHYFAQEQVDIAVVEVGLGGRLDCTNIITPLLSVITNISLDHTQFLGDTLVAVASEKAGIIKAGVPVIIGEALPETRPVFAARAQEVGAPITFAQDAPEIIASEMLENGLRQYATRHFDTFSATLTGDCQIHNTNTLLHAMDELIRLLPERAEHLRAAIPEAFLRVSELTHLRGRWEQVGAHPTIICDAGHNAGGWAYLGEQLQRAAAHHPTLHILFGMAEDKDIDAVLQKLPQKARYYFTQASVKRAMPAERLSAMAAQHSLHGETYPTVQAAKAAALAAAGRDDMIFVGGSCFVVADYLSEEA